MWKILETFDRIKNDLTTLVSLTKFTQQNVSKVKEPNLKPQNKNETHKFVNKGNKVL